MVDGVGVGVGVGVDVDVDGVGVGVGVGVDVDVDVVKVSPGGYYVLLIIYLCANLLVLIFTTNIRLTVF